MRYLKDRLALPRVLALLAFSLAAVGTGAQEVGTVVFAEGFPELTRDGRPVFEQVDFGFRVENLDSFTTDLLSSFEIELDPQTGVTATIVVDSGTQFYLDISTLQNERTTSIELLAGSISARVNSLAGSSRFQIQTATAVAGVRGTEFTVTTEVGGEILISADEGLVEVTHDERRRLFASPGEAVEIVEDENRFANLRYEPSAIGSFREEWKSQRRELFRERAPAILVFQGRQYRRRREAFLDAYGRLMAERELLEAWIQDDEEARRFRPAERAARAAAAGRIMGEVVRVRGTLRRFETVFVRLETMEPLVADFAPEVEIDEGFTGADLYELIARDRRVVQEQIAMSRYMVKLFQDQMDTGSSEE